MKSELCKDEAQNTGEKLECLQWNLIQYRYFNSREGCYWFTGMGGTTTFTIVTTNMGNALDQEIKVGNNALN